MLLGGLAASLPALARASDLHWSGSETCTDRGQLLFQVERALGTPLAQVGHLQLQIRVERTQPDAKALLRVSNAVGDVDARERSLVARDCAALIDTLAVAITLAVEEAGPFSAAQAHGVANEPELKSTSDASASPAPPRDAVALSATAEGARAGPVPRVSALLVGDSGSLPAPALGVALGLELDWSQLQLELLGTFWLEQHPELEPTTPRGAGADLNLATATVRGCSNPLGPSPRAVSASLCLGLELGRLSGNGTGITEPRRASALWLAPGLQARLAFHLPGTQLRILAQLGAALPLERSEFVLDRLGTVHQPNSLVARAAVGLDVALQ